MNEVGRMADIAQKNLEEAMDMVMSKDETKKKDVLQRRRGFKLF
jgi:phosphate uptake regulator